MAKAAATAVWGEQKTETKQEPISGVQGDTSKGEPFDKGNDDVTKDSDHKETAAFAKNSGTAAESDDVPDNPSTNLKAKDTPQDSTKGQNDVRDPEDPKTHPKNVPSDVDNTGEGVNEAQKLDGPGPAPLEEVARKHGGDAGQSETSVDKKAEGEDDEEDGSGPGAKSTGEGTGEKYVKSSGLKADGGDFDATKPGAGREADRLLEEKGIHHEKPGATSASDPSESKSAGGEEKEKRSLKDKIKATFKH